MKQDTDFDNWKEAYLDKMCWGEVEDNNMEGNHAHDEGLRPRLVPGISEEFSLAFSHYHRIAVSEQDLERLYRLLKAWKQGRLEERKHPAWDSDDEIIAYVPAEVTT